MNTVFNKTFWHFALSFFGIVLISVIITGFVSQFDESLIGDQTACPTEQTC